MIGRASRLFLSLTLATLLLTPLVIAAEVKDDLTQKTQELENIHKKIREHQEIIGKTEKKAREVAHSIEVIEKDLDRQNKLHEKVTGQIGQTKTDISGLQVELFNERKKYELAQVSLANKFDQYNRLSGTPFFETLFSSDEFTDHMNELHFFEAMISTNVQFLDDIRDKKIKLAKKENNLNNKLGFLKDKETEIVVLTGQIETNKKTKEKLYKDLLEQKKEYEGKLRDLEKVSNEIQQLIVRLQKQGKAPTPRMGDGRFIWPVVGPITDGFGPRIHPIFKVQSFHTGIDIGAPEGRPVFAAADGIALFSGPWGGYGKTIVLDHGGGYTTIYGHLSAYYVKRATEVKKGQIIGLVGQTGWATGPHLHFEVRINGKEVDPINYLPSR